MIKITLNKIIIAAVFFALLSCAKEKKETQSENKQTTEVKDSVVAPVQPQVTSPAPSMHKDTVAKYSPVSDPKATGCDMLHKGTFTYKDSEGEDVTVKIVDGIWTEEHKKGQYVTIAKMKWTGKCEYENMLIMSSLPNFKLAPGTVMDVVIDKTEGNDIYFTATAAGKSYHSMLTKI